MPDPPSDAASLTVLAGPMKGHRILFDDAVDDILIGSDPDCRLCLDVPGVSPIHARLWLDPEGATLYDTHSAAGVFVNDDRVAERRPLRDGDIVWLGAPAEPGSVMLQFRHPGAAPAEAPPPPAPAEDPFDVAELMPDAPLAAPAPAVAEPAADEDDWLIQEVMEAPAAAPEAPAEDALESMLEDEAPSPSAAADEDFYVLEEPPPPAPAAQEAPAADDELFDWAAPLEPAARAAPAAPPDLAPPDFEPSAFEPSAFEPSAFEPSAALEPEAPREEAMVIDETEPAEDPLLLDWSEPVSPPPPVKPAAPPAPMPPPPAPAPEFDDEDVFYVDSVEQAAAPPAPPPPPARSTAVPAPAPPPAEAPAARAVVGGAVPRARPPRAPAAEPAPRATAPAPRPRGGGGGVSRKGVLIMAGGALFAVVAAGVIALQLLGAPRVDSVQPTRVRGGDTIVIQGKNFSADAAAVVVRFEGQREGRILRAGANRLEVEVPAIPAAPGRVNRVPVEVSVAGRSSKAVEISVYQAPRIHGIAPSVAMAGEEVTLAGTDWGSGATVRFGGEEAQVVELTPTSIRVRVPSTNAPEGTPLPVVVAMAGDASNEATFHLGRLPLVLSVEPRAVNPGDPLVLKGMGFAAQPSANDLRVGGVRAVVVKAGVNEILALVPRTPADGQNAVELRVPGSAHVAQSTLTVAPPADPIDFRFIVEHPAAAGIEDPENGHDHVVLSTALGPAFLISAAEGASAAERAAEAQRRLNEAAVALKASVTADLEVRNLEGLPSIGLVGKQEPLLVVTGEDAAAYDEEWARGRGKAEAVTPARLAIWWSALARDLVLLLVRGDRPRHAPALAAEGRALLTLHEAARRTGRFGVPREAFTSAPGPLRQAVRLLGLRLPAAVKAPVEAAAAPAVVQGLAVDGMWTGSETDGSGTRYVTVTFAGGGGTFTHERALSLTIPLQSVQQTGRRELRFEFRSGIHLRRYEGTWDGQRLRGRILSEEGAEIGRFELERKR